MKNLIILLILLFCVSCGYKPIYSGDENLKFEFKKITLITEEKIKRQILNSLYLKENSFDDKELIIKINYNIEETSKNSKGQVETYRSIISGQLTIKKEEEILKTDSFTKEFSYNNKNNNYELVKYQNEIKNNLTSEIINEILFSLKLL